MAQKIGPREIAAREMRERNYADSHRRMPKEAKKAVAVKVLSEATAVAQEPPAARKARKAAAKAAKQRRPKPPAPAVE